MLCNDKLVGVYDFVEDDDSTDEIEEHNNGKDNAGHGTHVSSIAAGNPLFVSVGDIPAEIAGVAPNANIVSYRVCYIGDPADADDDGCQSSAILRAVDQAIADGVDVINYSIGSNAYDPWLTGQTTYAFLNARAAGIFVATSTGNAGPNPGSIGAPANAPWITSVGNATHDRMYATVLEYLNGGDTTPPTGLIGASLTDGVAAREIVHAKDFGYPLCGVGTPQSQADCASNTGASNPFADERYHALGNGKHQNKFWFLFELCRFPPWCGSRYYFGFRQLFVPCVLADSCCFLFVSGNLDRGLPHRRGADYPSLNQPGDAPDQHPR